MNMMAGPMPYISSNESSPSTSSAHPNPNPYTDPHPHTNTDTDLHTNLHTNLKLSHSIKQAESPLATLVRRTSSRRMRGAAAGREQFQQQVSYFKPQPQDQQEGQYASYYDQQQGEPAHAQGYAYGHAHDTATPTADAYNNYTDEAYAYAYSDDPNPNIYVDSVPTNMNHTPPRHQPSHLDTARANQPLAPPHSPLLHSHFARDSYATASSADDTSYLYADTSGIRTSTASSRSRSSSGERGGVDDGASDYRYRYFDDDTSSVYSQRTMQMGRGQGQGQGQGQGPALRDSWRSTDTGGTYSRALSNDPRPSQQQQPYQYQPPSQALSQSQPQPPSPSSPIPALVISSPSDSLSYSPSPEQHTRGGRTPIVKPVTANFSRPVREAAHKHEVVGERVTVQLPEEMREGKMKVLERNARRGVSPSPSPSPHSQNASVMEGNGSIQPPGMKRGGERSSPVSVYSAYSYYNYDSAMPSPTGSQGSGPPVEQSNQFLSPTPNRSPTTTESAGGGGLRTPQDYLQLGIQHHEANRLEESARCFERSAKESGGCGVGMLMYGLALRHGWGCAKNEKVGFRWLRKAAESAVVDLERVRVGGDVDAGAVQTELVLAIYEVGQCYFHGWGVAKDQKMGVSYYTVAARLGDGDAQGDLAFCLANGKGCKKDKNEAARWYRAAVKQGYSDVGLAWIYKDKYQQ
ncbi:hypothetical protein B0H34DRAFT_685197 [Crassisporium funariophilum]|nr:hypothetical protein B0H34DRAFT_685197 [Crassisporium funariophilum]